MITRIGKYEIKAKLGEGGFGTVYRGFDPRVGWDVAIKVLSERADADTMRRFPEEAGMTGKLRHKNIVTVHDYGEEDGRPYLVMELLEGENLHDIIQSQNRHPLSIMQKVQIMLQVAEGLYYAHQNGVIHRDVKPANIMVAPDLTVKIMDFGIARITGRGTRQTRQGDLIGSFLYMAPELFESMDADPQTDIFAYGDTFYELLTGRQPFYAENLALAISQIRSLEPVRIRELFPECPPRLEAIVERTLKKDRELRYQNLNDVVFALRPILIELREARASTALDEVRRLVDAQQWKESDRLVKLVLDLDPANREAWQLHEKIQEEIRKEEIRKHVDKLLKDAEQLIGQQKLDEAILRLESAHQLDQANQVISSRLEEVKGFVQAKRMAGRLVAEARAMALDDDLDGAIRKVNQALEGCPGHLDAQGFKKELQPKLEQRDKVRQEQSLLEQAKALCSHGDYERAIALLSSEECKSLNSRAIAEYRTRLESEWAAEFQRRRKQEFETRLQAAEKLLSQQNLAALEEALLEIRGQFPEQAAGSIRFTMLREGLAGRRQTERVEAIRQNVESLCEARQFGAAREALRVGQSIFPEDLVLKSLPQRIFDAEWDHARSVRIAEVNEKVHQLLKAGKLQDALRILQSPETEALQDPALKQWREQLTRQEQEEGLRIAREEGQQLLDFSQYAKALAVLKEHCSRYPDDAGLEVLLRQAQRGVDIDEERAVVNATISSTTELQGARQWRQALEVGEAAATRYPKNPTLKILVADLQNAVQEHERLETLIGLRQKIEELIQQQNFKAAKAAVDSARKQFPGEPQIDIAAKSVDRAESMAELTTLCRQVDQLLSEDKVDAASKLLDSVRNRFAQETIWQFWYRELEKKQRYLSALIEAKQLLNAKDAAKDYDRAEQILKEAIPGAPDQRAATLLKQVAEEHRKHQEQTADQEREQQKIRQQREEVQRIMDVATEFNRTKSYADSIRVLTEGCGKYPKEESLKLLLRATRSALEDLERERALQEGLQRCESLRRNQQWQQALDVIAKLVSEYRNRGDLLELQIRIRQEKDLAEKETGIRNACDQAEQHMAAGRPDLAVNLLRPAIRDYGEEPRLIALTQRAEQAQRDDQERLAQHQQQVAAEAAALKEGIDREDLPWLQTKVFEVTKLFPREQIFQDLSQEVQRLEREDFARKLNEGRRLLNAGQIQEAEEFVRSKLLNHSDQPEVAALMTAIADEKRRRKDVQAELEQRAANVAEGLRAAQSCENKGDLDGALRVLEPCLQRYSDDAQLIAARERIGEKIRGAKRSQVFDGIRRALNATQWPLALELINRARDEYQNDPELISLEDKALDQRRTFLESAVAAIRAKLAAKKPEDAQKLFDQNLARYPNESIVRTVAEEIEAERLKREFIAENLRQVAQAEQQGDFKTALAILTKALKRYSADPELSEALSRVEAKRAEAAKLSAIKKLLDRGKWEEALPQLETLRGTALANPAEFARLETQARELRGQTINRPVQPAKPRGLLYGIGAAVLAVGGLVAWLITHRSVPPPVVDVSPTSLTFEVQPGTRPPAQKITVTGISHVDHPTTPVSWLQVGRGSSGGTTTEFTVRVEPDGLGPGPHDADVTFPSLSKTVHVTATIPNQAIVRFDPPSLTFTLDARGGTQPQKLRVTGPSEIPKPKSNASLKVTPNLIGPGKAEFTVELLPKSLVAGGSTELIFSPEDKVRVDVAGSQAQPITIDRKQVMLTADQNGNVAQQKFTVTSSTPVSTPTPSAGWVKFRRDDSPGHGRTDFWVYPAPEVITPGAKLSADLRFSSDKSVRIDLSVPGFDIEPKTLNFTATGQSKTVTITGPAKIPDLKSGVDWVTVSRGSSSPGKAEFTVSIPNGVHGGPYNTELSFGAGMGVAVTLTLPQQQIKQWDISKAALSFEYHRGTPDPKDSFTVTGPADSPDPTKKPAWVQLTRGPGGVFQVEILAKMLDPAQDNYRDDIVFNFPPEKAVHVHVQAWEVPDELLTSIGTIGWTGNLNTGEDLVIKGPYIVKGSGKVIRGVMAAVKIRQDSLNGLELVAQPTAANNFKIHLRNSTARKVNSLSMIWDK